MEKILEKSLKTIILPLFDYLEEVQVQKKGDFYLTEYFVKSFDRIHVGTSIPKIISQTNSIFKLSGIKENEEIVVNFKRKIH